VNIFIIISYTILEKFKKVKISTHLWLHNNQNWQLFFHHLKLQKDPDPWSGSGSEIPDFQFENPDPDPKSLISDPEHWFQGPIFVSGDCLGLFQGPIFVLAIVSVHFKVRFLYRAIVSVNFRVRFLYRAIVSVAFKVLANFVGRYNPKIESVAEDRSVDNSSQARVVRFFTFAIVDTYGKWVLISRNHETSKFHKSLKFQYHQCQNSAKFCNFVKIDIWILQNLERSMLVSSKLQTFAEFWFRYYWNFDISWNSNIFIMDGSKFRKNSIFW